jgi:hypothetical protein
MAIAGVIGLYDILKRAICFAAHAHMVGWVKRDSDTIYVGFAYLNAPQKFEIATQLANPTRLVVNRRLNPTYDLLFRQLPIQFCTKCAKYFSTSL